MGICMDWQGLNNLGTGFIINKSTGNSILNHKMINGRICQLRLKGRFRNLILLSVHAPTEEI